jgi:hypothetical protein
MIEVLLAGSRKHNIMSNWFSANTGSLILLEQMNRTVKKIIFFLKEIIINLAIPVPAPAASQSVPAGCSRDFARYGHGQFSGQDWMMKYSLKC